MLFFNKKKGNKGFTLIELLVTITIIGIFIMTAVPYLSDFIQRAQTDNIIDELNIDLNSGRISAVSSGEDVTFRLRYNWSTRGYYWELTEGSKKIKKKDIMNDNVLIFFSHSSFKFSSLGFLQNSSGNNITSASITMCNVLSKSGKTISLNAFGKTKTTEVSC